MYKCFLVLQHRPNAHIEEASYEYFVYLQFFFVYNYLFEFHFTIVVNKAIVKWPLLLNVKFMARAFYLKKICLLMSNENEKN